MRLAPVVLALAAAARAAATKCSFDDTHPKRYAAFHTAPGAITIDGKLDEAAWGDVAWTDAFMDIEGPAHSPQPWFATRVKMRYDNEFLYVGAHLEETSVWANQTQRNTVVFHDNDFEVFVDPTGSTHWYKEFEVNALNTTWNLLLNKPYRNGGGENSTRVDPEHGFDMFGKGMKSAVYMEGKPNDPAANLTYWTVEVALPLKELAKYTPAVVPPAPNSFWRINFSRVEWWTKIVNGHYEKLPNKAEENWVWSPQYAIAMHMPERWGYVQFRPPHEAPAKDAVVPLDPEWSVRYVSFQYFYAQYAFHDANKHYASSLDELRPFFKEDPRALPCLHVVDIALPSQEEYQARVAVKDDVRWIATIQSDSFISVAQRATIAWE
ncbi:TPA: hypothetical protein N0F65_006938 [Lagenidium giganteum]|uniref:Carbohydrate-binding domain-containing protein n=1 Tax=Lagenidium giganteum TaxID=4803 RepID=A0AAV2ZFX4_9STRA|nr:TPA: hypothetical protein N0F65_006938 [Lagenidium giganteum]